MSPIDAEADLERYETDSDLESDRDVHIFNSAQPDEALGGLLLRMVSRTTLFT